MKKFVTVPWWMWNVYFGLNVLGADGGWEFLSAVMMLLVGYVLTRDQV